MALNLKGGRPTATEMQDAEDVVEQAVETQAEAKASPAAETVEEVAEQAVETVEEAKASPAAETVEEVAEQVSESREVAPQASQAVAVAAPAGSASYFHEMIRGLEEAGFEGLKMGYGVFPVVSLDKGEFKVGDEDVGRDPFQIVPLLSRPKFAYRTTGVPEKEAEVVFADDNRAHHDPDSPVAQAIAEWKQKFENSGWEVKEYLDVFGYVVNFPGQSDLANQLVQLSVAPQSVKNFTRAGLAAAGRGRKPHECVYEVSVGEKVRGEFDFYPWAFKAIGSCQKLGVEVKFGTDVDEDF